MTRPTLVTFWASALIVLLAFALRVHQLGAQSLWHDEGNSYVQATRSLISIAENAARDIHPPGYYWLLAGWRALAGETELALRALSAFASVITVALTITAGRVLFCRGAGLLAGLIVALNTFAIYYAQEARMYALLALWVAAALCLTLCLLRRPSPQFALALGLVNAAGLYTHYAYPLFMAGQGAAALIYLLRYPTRARWLAYVGANLLALAIFAPLLPTALRQVTGWGASAYALPTTDLLMLIVRWLTIGLTAEAVFPSIPLALLLIGALIALRQPTRVAFPALMLIVPVGVFVALGTPGRDDLKSLLPAVSAAALLLALPAAALWRWGWIGRAAAMVAAGLLVATMIVSVPSLYVDRAYQRDDYRTLAASLDADAVILSAPNQAEVFGYYYRGGVPIYPLPAGLGGDDAATRAAVQRVIEDYGRIAAVFWGEGERDPNRIVETTLDAQAFELNTRWFGDVRLTRYIGAAPLPIARASDARFGGSIMLLRADLSAATTCAGDPLLARLTWRGDAAIDRRYKVFVQLLDANGVLVTQRDSEPGGGLALTTTWTPGQPVRDNHALIIPPEVAPGTYTLIVGLYDLDDPAQRLPVGDGDHVTVASVRVEACQTINE